VQVFSGRSRRTASLTSAFGRVSAAPAVADAFRVIFSVPLFIALPLVQRVSTLYSVLIEQPCMNRDWPAHLAAAPAGRARACPGV
jgi:hypothetical protein